MVRVLNPWVTFALICIMNAARYATDAYLTMHLDICIMASWLKWARV